MEISHFQDFTIIKEAPISFIGIGDFENIDILKEREGDNLGDLENGEFPIF